MKNPNFESRKVNRKFWTNGSVLALILLFPLIYSAMLFGSSDPASKAKVDAVKRLNISPVVAQTMLKQKVSPVYPPIARAARVSGTVVLQVTISKTGAVQDLHVVSGPAMLQMAAFNAVQQWRYKPYEVNNEPVEVETTISVIFSLGG